MMVLLPSEHKNSLVHSFSFSTTFDESSSPQLDNSASSCSAPSKGGHAYHTSTAVPGVGDGDCNASQVDNYNSSSASTSAQRFQKATDDLKRCWSSLSPHYYLSISTPLSLSLSPPLSLYISYTIYLSSHLPIIVMKQQKK